MNEKNVDVLKEDQENINTFNKLHLRKQELEVELKTYKKLCEDLEDASNELIVADDEMVRFEIGDCLFVHITQDEAEERLQGELDKAQKELENHQNQIEEISIKMDKLKAILYGKFGNTINLD